MSDTERPEGTPAEGTAASEAAWARLRAADPVAGEAGPDAAALTARVLAGLDAAAADVTTGESTASGAGGGSGTGSGRRLLAAAAAVALLAGVGAVGVAVGRGSVDQSRTLASGYVMPALNSPPGAATAQSGGPESGTAEPTTGGNAPVPLGADAAKSSMPWYGGRTLLTPGPALPDDPGTASGYLLDGGDIDARRAAQRLADALGVPGKPREQDGSWVVGPYDGTAATVVVTPGGLVSWWFDDPTASPWACPVASDPGASATAEPATGADSPDAAPAVDCTPATGEPPSERAAENQARDLLRGAGLAPGDWSWRTVAEPVEAGGVVTVTATLEVDGGSTGMAWSAMFGGAGLFSASGFLASAVEVPGYPVVGARTAALRSLDPRWSTLGPTPVYREGDAVPLAAESDVAVSSSGVGAAGGTEPAPTVDGRPVLVATVDEATVTAAQLDLTQYWQADGSLLLLPAYLFTADDGRAWSMVAVTDEYVRFAPVESAAPVPGTAVR